MRTASATERGEMATETAEPAALRAIEVRSIDWVPVTERHGRIWHQAPLGMNAYGGMLTGLTGIDSVRSSDPSRHARVSTIIALTVIWYAIAKTISASAVSTVFTALTLMLYLLVPWTATNLVDFFLVRRGHYKIRDLFTPNGIYGAWAWRGLTAYAVGFAAEIPFMILPDLGGWSYTGPLAPNGIDIAWL